MCKYPTTYFVILAPINLLKFPLEYNCLGILKDL